MNIGHVKECHDPRNVLCPHNTDAVFNCDCHATVARQRKTYREVRLPAPELPHGCKPEVVMEVHNNGQLLFRELGRRKSSALGTTVGEIYNRLLMNAARRLAAERRARRAERRKHR